jgi:hypothetical protein
MEGARTWWERAADAGSTAAMFQLARLAEARGDLAEAERWRVLASEAKEDDDS